MSKSVMKNNIILGRDENGLITSEDSKHVFVYGPSGSGKGVSFVIPNLLFWEGSAVVHDIKRENFEITSGWREKSGSRIYLWNPACKNGESHCYNPLDYISDDPVKIVDDVQRIAHFILPIHEFWSNEGRALLVSIILWITKDKSKPKSLGEVVRIIRNKNFYDTLAHLLENDTKVLHPVARMNFGSFLQKAAQERSGVLSCVSAALELWANPVIDKLSSKSDFDLRSLNDEKMTIYVCVPADSIKRVRQLLHIFYDQLTSILCEQRCKEPITPSVLMMMDDFVTLGTIESLDRGINYYRSYGIKFCCVSQSPAQIDKLYSSGINSFFVNASYRIAYAPNDRATASLISHLTQIQDNSGDLRQLSNAEIYTLSENNLILQTEAKPSQIVDKLKYYQDELFITRLFPPVHISYDDQM